MKRLLQLVSCGVLIIFSQDSVGMHEIVLVTNDEIEFKVTIDDIAASKMLFNIFTDTDATLAENKIVLPVISSETLSILLPLLSLVSKYDQKDEINEHIALYFHEKNLDISRYVELLNAVNFLAADTVIKFIIKTVAEVIVFNVGTLDLLIKMVQKFDLPDELSWLLGKKIIKMNSKTVCSSYTKVLRGVLQNKNVSAYALCSLQKYIAYAIPDEGVTVVDIQNKTEFNFARYGDLVKEICFSCDGSKIAILSVNNENKKAKAYEISWSGVRAVKDTSTEETIRVLSCENEMHKCLHRLSVRDCHIKNILFSPVPDLLIAITDNNQLIKCNLEKIDDDAWSIEAVSSYFFKEWNPVNDYFFKFNKEGVLVPDPFYACKKVISNWSLQNVSLMNELRNLKAEYALLFVKIVEHVAAHDSLTLTEFGKARICELLENKAIKSCFKDYTWVGKKQYRCLIS